MEKDAQLGTSDKFWTISLGAESLCVFCMLSPKCGLAWDRPITIFFSMRNLGAGRVTAAAKGSAATTLSEEWVALAKVREIYWPKFSILLFSHSSAALHGAGKKQKTWRPRNLQIAQ